MASDVLVFSAQSTVCSARRMFSVCCQQNNLNFNGLRQTSKRFVTPYEIEIIVYTLPSPSSVSSLLLLARSFALSGLAKRLADSHPVVTRIVTKVGEHNAFPRTVCRAVIVVRLLHQSSQRPNACIHVARHNFRKPCHYIDEDVQNRSVQIQYIQ